MYPRPPRSNRTHTPFPYSTLFRSKHCIVERQRMVLENPRVDLRVSADPATRLHELKWIVDRLHTEHFVLAEIPYREARLVRIASYDDFVKAARQAADLNLQIILIRPEPRDLFMATHSPPNPYR